MKELGDGVGYQWVTIDHPTSPQPWREGGDPADIELEDATGEVIAEFNIVACQHGHMVDGMDIAKENRRYTVRAVNAFSALLAVAKAAKGIQTSPGAWKLDHKALAVAMFQLEAKHPDWLDWAP